MKRRCRDCGSEDLVKRGNGFKSRCRECYNAYNRRCYHANREVYLKTRRKLNIKHADSKRSSAKEYKLEHRERYSLLEWFRKKGFKASDIDNKDLDALVEMKKALKAAKESMKHTK